MKPLRAGIWDADDWMGRSASLEFNLSVFPSFSNWEIRDVIIGRLKE